MKFSQSLLQDRLAIFSTTAFCVIYVGIIEKRVRVSSLLSVNLEQQFIFNLPGRKPAWREVVPILKEMLWSVTADVCFYTLLSSDINLRCSPDLLWLMLCLMVATGDCVQPIHLSLLSFSLSLCLAKWCTELL